MPTYFAKASTNVTQGYVEGEVPDNVDPCVSYREFDGTHRSSTYQSAPGDTLLCDNAILTGAARATSMEELCRAPPWRLLVQPSALQSSSMEVARAALRDTPAELCAKTSQFVGWRHGAIDCKLETDGGRPVRAAIPPLRAAERKEVKVKLNRDANQRIDFIWRRVPRVSQTDGELSEQSCAEAIDCKLGTDGGRPVRAAIPPLRAAERKEVKAKLNGDANQKIDIIWRRALRVSQTDGELSEQSCAELRSNQNEAMTPTNELSCFGAELLTASLKPTEADCQSSNTTSAGRCVERKEVKVKLNGDANQRIDFIWRRALRVSQTDGELSEQSCAELRDEVFIFDTVLAVYRLLLTELYRKLNPALRGYRGGLHEQPPWRSSAELRAERATSMEELCRAPPWS
ncbi:hypothetical protein Bbelb_132830 [Branchiostoma belcheri]|nr:hypothetical protein Bbelb_132830 [Branchiostoma belcheri]